MKLTINDDIYGGQVIVYTHMDNESTAKELKKIDIEWDVDNDWGGYCLTANTACGGLLIIILVNKITEWNQLPNVLTHEVFHATIRTMQHVGVGMDYDNHEAIAYYNGWLNSKVLPFVFQQYEKEAAKEIAKSARTSAKGKKKTSTPNKNRNTKTKTKTKV